MTGLTHPNPAVTPESRRSEAAIAGDVDVAPIVERARVQAADQRFGEALAELSGALSRHPGHPELLFHRACTLLDWGRYREARDGLLAAREQGCARLALDLNLALACQLLGRLDEAEAHARRAVASDPASVPAHAGLAAILIARGRPADAAGVYERALVQSPADASMLTALSSCRCQLGDFAGAEAAARDAIASDPARPSGFGALALALFAQGRRDESLDAHAQAVRRDDEAGVAAESFANYAACLLDCGRASEARALLERCLPRHPSPVAHAHYGFALLTLGDFREGWAQYEFRWFQDPLLAARPKYPLPTWSGQPLAGRTILLWAEQGLGDVIQFGRYASAFKALGARVLLQVHEGMGAFGACFADVDRSFAKGEAFTSFDFHLPLMSVPHALATDVDTVPARVPYLTPDAQRVAQWAPRVGGAGTLRVGLVWAGNPSHRRDVLRSIPLQALEPLWSVAGVTFVSLQKDVRDRDRPHYPPPAVMADLAPAFGDLMDAAAVIASLDLVVCVDTAVAHLAGAMGKPVWLLLPASGDFRWMERRDDSPWYPTMRLFRQRRLGEWDDVVACVRDELARGAQAGAIEPATAGRAIVPRDSARPRADRPRVSQVVEARHGIFQYWPDDTPVADDLVRDGEHRERELALVRALLAAGAHVVEVHAGIGAHTVPLAALVGSAGHVLAYEPRPLHQRVLRQNLEANRVAGAVTVMRGALGGPSPPAETIDLLQLERLDLLKINAGPDAAGIVEGAADTLWRLRPVVVAAVADRTSLPSLAESVRACGYRCWEFAMPARDPANFNRRVVQPDEANGIAIALVAIPEEAGGSLALADCREILASGATLPISAAPADADLRATTGAAAAAPRGGFLRRVLGALGIAGPAADTATSALERDREQAAALFREGRFAEASAALERVVGSGGATAQDASRYGWSLLNSGRAPEAEPWMRRALAGRDDDADAHFGLGVALQRIGDHAQSLAHFRKAIGIAPRNADFLQAAAALELEHGDPIAAGQLAERAAEAAPGSASAQVLHGMMAFRQDRLPEAIAAFDRATSLERAGGQGGEAFVNLAIALVEDGRNAEAIELLERELPDHPVPYGGYLYSLSLLRAGRFAEGWAAHAFRWATPRFSIMRPSFAKPEWRGQDLAGRTLMLFAEQGLGDMLQFVRYAPMLKARGATVHLQAWTGLEAVMRGVAGVDRVYGRNERAGEFDFYAYLLDLPAVFGTDFASIPRDVPYVRVDEARVARWAPRVGGGPDLRVGVVWAGNRAHDRDRHRSLPFERLKPLAAIAGVRYVSLQVGAGEAETARAEPWLDPIGAELADFADTAAVIEHLDLVVTVDTAVAHLAGAMGKPVWLLLPRVADFRWLERRDDSPWYPSMRIFRQPRRGDWDGVIAAVAGRLRDVVGDRAALAPPRPGPSPSTAGVPAARRQGAAITTTRHGLFLYAPDERGIGSALPWYGEWREAELRVVAGLVAPGATVLVAGAGIGVHTVALAKRAGDGGHVLVAESRPRFRRLLQANLAANGVSRVTMLPAETKAIDELALARVDLIELSDARSAAAALAGAALTLERLRPIVYAQLEDMAAMTEAAAIAKGLGYRCFRMETPAYARDNFNARTTALPDGAPALAMLAVPAERPRVELPAACVEIS
ncbi:MAG: tetratricopeptide repeat protein [Burkholderiales bacterium]